MTLSDHVRDKRSPVRRALEEHAEAVEAFRDQVRDVCTGDPVLPSVDGDVPWSPIGHAVSVRLCWALDRQPPASVTASARRYGAPVAAVVAMLDEDPEELGADVAARVAWWCGQLDRLARHRPPVDRDDELFSAVADVDELLDAAPVAWVDDVAAVAARNEACVTWLENSGAVIGAPTFAGSAAVGGADGDLIVGSTLWEIKCAIGRRPRLREIHQLIGYALLDTDDTFGLSHVGYWSARFGTQVRVPLADIVGDVAAAKEAVRVAAEEPYGLAAEIAAIIAEAESSG